TPSFNQGQFLEETIRSVLLQGYPNLEYLIIDGGSTDRSVEIIKKYEPWLAYWVSEPDRGQSHAINKGFKRATGEILAWLNSDDIYLPCTLIKVCRVFLKQKADLVTGGIVRNSTASGQDVVIGRAAEYGITPTVGLFSVSAPLLHQSSTFW